MPQSLVKNYVHLVFSTKYRQPFITKDIQQNLYAYMIGICRKLECYVQAIGGVEDHVHILCLHSKKIALIKLLEELKSHSSKWAKTQGEAHQNFYWQNGYGSFSVSPTAIDKVIQYIENQEEHHKNQTFKDEYRALLHKYKMDFDEQYVWE